MADQILVLDKCCLLHAQEIHSHVLQYLLASVLLYKMECRHSIKHLVMTEYNDFQSHSGFRSGLRSLQLVN